MHQEEYIVVLKNIIPDVLCDAIIQEYKDCHQWEQAVAMNIPQARKCSTIHMSTQDDLYRKQLDSEVLKVAINCIHEYKSKFNNCIVEEDTGYELLRYEVGGYYKEHIDFHSTLVRTLSCSLNLNDDYEGGEFSFFDNTSKYTLGKGDALLFPSNFMYPHEVTECTKGTRYSFVSWAF